MKRSPLKRLGKRGKLNAKANRTLAREFKGARYCEAKFPHDCTGSEQLSWAHSAKRRRQPDLLHAALVCINAHSLLEVKPPEVMKQIVDEMIANRDTEITA